MNDFTRIAVTVPFSIVRLIDKIIEERKLDGEIGTSKAAVALELLKIGARVKEREMNKVASVDVSLNEKLKFIANSASSSDAKANLLIDLLIYYLIDISSVPESTIKQIVDKNKTGREERLNQLFGR